VRALCDAFAVGDAACIVRMLMVKKFIIWPFVPVFLCTYLYRSKALFIFHNKKLFDMCNVGEQYELGYGRNVILRKCNELLEREDFWLKQMELNDRRSTRTLIFKLNILDSLWLFIKLFWLCFGMSVAFKVKIYVCYFNSVLFVLASWPVNLKS